MRNFFLLSLLLLLAACTRAAAPPSTQTATEQDLTTLPAPLAEVVATATAPLPPAEGAAPTGNATSSPIERAAATASPAPSVTASSPATVGHTAEGAYYLGDPAAPVTIIDYSDFM